MQQLEVGRYEIFISDHGDVRDVMRFDEGGRFCGRRGRENTGSHS